MSEKEKLEPLRSDFWLDLESVECYLSLHAVRQALTALKSARPLHVSVRPFFVRARDYSKDEVANLVHLAAERGIILDPDTVSNRGEDTSGGDRNAWWHALPSQQLVAYASDLTADKNTTFGAHSLELRLTEGLMRAHFELGANLNDPEVVISIGQDFGIGGAEILQVIEDPGLKEEVLAQFNYGVHLGVKSVPVLVVEDTYQIPGLLDSEGYTNALRTALERTDTEERR